MVLELLQYHRGHGARKLHLIYHPVLPQCVPEVGRYRSLCCWGSVLLAVLQRQPGPAGQFRFSRFVLPLPVGAPFENR